MKSGRGKRLKRVETKRKGFTTYSREHRRSKSKLLTRSADLFDGAATAGRPQGRTHSLPLSFSLAPINRLDATTIAALHRAAIFDRHRYSLQFSVRPLHDEFLSSTALQTREQRHRCAVYAASNKNLPIVAAP